MSIRIKPVASVKDGALFMGNLRLFEPSSILRQSGCAEEVLQELAKWLNVSFYGCDAIVAAMVGGGEVDYSKSYSRQETTDADAGTPEVVG